MKWMAAALLLLLATTGQATEKNSSSPGCGFKLGSGGEQAEKSRKYEPQKFRNDYQDTRPLPLQTDAEKQDFSLHVKSDNGERNLMQVFTVARFECSLD